MLWLGVHFPLLPLEVFCGSGLPAAISSGNRGREAAPTKKQAAPTTKNSRSHNSNRP